MCNQKSAAGVQDPHLPESYHSLTMRLPHLSFPVLAAMLGFCHAAPLPPGGTDLIPPGAEVKAWGGEGGSAAKADVTGQDFKEAMKVTIAKGDTEVPWHAQLVRPLASGSIKNGDRLLVTYMARCVSGDTGTAAAKLQLRDPASSMIGMTESITFGKEWEQVDQPLLAKLDVAAGEGELVLFLGEEAQSVEIANVRVLNYGSTIDLSALPHRKKTYAGRETGAPWRKDALQRIEKIRKADYSVKVTGPDGKPLHDTFVVVELDRHEFGFGSCVTRGMLTKEGPDGDRYRGIVAKTFSRIVFENDLKPDTFPRDAAGFAELEKSMAWLKERGIGIRGHYLMQEAVDGWSRERLADPAKLKADTLASVRERIAFAGDRVTEWDVINHPVAWQGAELFAQKGPPLDSLMMDVFKDARQLTKLPLLINEDQLFRPGPQQGKTFELLAKLKSDGVRVDGLGNQAHFHSSFLPSPEELLKVTDRFATVVPKQVITEFDVVTNGDDGLAADYLRDCMIACFSHPAYDGFLLWGFWEDSHWLPEAALWRKDWTIKPNGAVWEQMVGNQWHTREKLKTDKDGKVAWRGFKGSYRVLAGSGTSAPVSPGSAQSPVEVKVP
jgi:endo-1,4-beta-xylanase